ATSTSDTASWTSRRPGELAGACGSPLGPDGEWNLISSSRPWPSGVCRNAKSVRTSSSPTMLSTTGPSTDPSPCGSSPSATKNSVAAARSSTTMPTWSMRWIVMRSTVAERRPPTATPGSPLLEDQVLRRNGEAHPLIPHVDHGAEARRLAAGDHPGAVVGLPEVAGEAGQRAARRAEMEVVGEAPEELRHDHGRLGQGCQALDRHARLRGVRRPDPVRARRVLGGRQLVAQVGEQQAV